MSSAKGKTTHSGVASDKPRGELQGFKPFRNNPFFASFAHELKTPLAILSGYIEILQDGILGPLNENQDKALRLASVNCSRLKKLVQEFLSQAALGTQQVEVHLEVGDFNQCLTDVCNFWQQQVQAKSAALYFQPDPTFEPFLFDFDKVQHVVSNLFDNALKFTRPGGTIWLTAQRSQMKVKCHNGATTRSGNHQVRANVVPAIRVTVADTGPGIPAEFRTEVFQEFFQVPNHASSAGSGLGLSIAKRLVQAHGGRIWVESEPGAGTRVSFLIPVKGMPEAGNKPAEGRPSFAYNRL